MKKVLALVFAAVLAFSTMCLVACGGGINGTYQLTNVSGNVSGESSSVNTSDSGISATLTINDNTGNYSASYAGQSGTQVWVIDTKNKLITDGENNVWNYSSSGKTLTLTRSVTGGKVSMEFTKVS